MLFIQFSSMNGTVKGEIVQRFQRDFLSNRSYIPITIVLVYLIFVKYLGPWLMKYREPFKLNKILIVYNAIQVIWCGYIIHSILFDSLKLSYTCAKPDSYELIEQIVYFGRHYFFMKMFDLLDTIFFVLRKKFNQVTHLHVYHHAGMALVTYYLAYNEPEPKLALVVITNVIVHFVMYSYYLLTAYIKDHQNILWWKKHITQLQLLQFFVNFTVYSQMLFRNNCEMKTHVILIVVSQNLYMCLLFGQFYYKSYIEKKKV